jgi:hypothetical protein
MKSEVCNFPAISFDNNHLEVRQSNDGTQLARCEDFLILYTCTLHIWHFYSLFIKKAFVVILLILIEETLISLIYLPVISCVDDLFG